MSSPPKGSPLRDTLFLVALAAAHRRSDANSSNSPASARTRKNLEAQMRRAATHAARGVASFRAASTKRRQRYFQRQSRLRRELYRLVIAGHLKAFVKSLDSAWRERHAAVASAALAIVALSS